MNNIGITHCSQKQLLKDQINTSFHVFAKCAYPSQTQRLQGLYNVVIMLFIGKENFIVEFSLKSGGYMYYMAYYVRESGYQFTLYINVEISII